MATDMNYTTPMTAAEARKASDNSRVDLQLADIAKRIAEATKSNMYYITVGSDDLYPKVIATLKELGYLLEADDNIDTTTIDIMW